MRKFTAVRTKGAPHVAIQIAKIWASACPRSSNAIRFKFDEPFQGMSKFEMRITSTARGNLTPATESELHKFVIGVTKFANDTGYTACVTIEGESAR
jgi:hypothetical protein